MSLPLDPTGAVVGFIGLGTMGAPMAGHLLDAGFNLRVYSRSPETARELLRRGAVGCGTIAELAGHSDVVVTMVGDPEDVRGLYLDSGGIVEVARAGTYLVDMTTSTPDLARRIHAAAMQRGLAALDAPVSGGQVGAQKGRLTIMVGGDPETFAAMTPVLASMGANIQHYGAPGAGQTVKMCNQIAVAGIMLGIAEALSCAKSSDVDPWAVLEALRASTGSSVLLDRLGPKMLAEDHQPSFYIRHFIKDLTIALEESQAKGLDLPGVELVRGLYETLAKAGGGEQGIQALMGAYPPRFRGQRE